MHIPIDAYSTLRSVPEAKFSHEVLNHGTRGDSQLEDHLESVLGYVASRGGKEMTFVKYHIWRHIQRVKHHVALAVDEADMERFGQWADAANAIYLLPDGSLRDPNGRVLIAKDGSSDIAAKLPHPPDAWARKARVEASLEEMGILVPPHLPPVVGEAEVELRSIDETARRALALFLVVRRAASLLDYGGLLSQAELERRSPIAAAALSPREREFLAAATPSQQEVVNFCWRVEALHLLLWAIGGALNLPFPSHVCSLPDLEKFMESVSEAEFLAHASFRATGSILDALDMHLRCHWSIVERRKRGELDEHDPLGDVVPERHHALNWLVRFENADWDDTQTPT